MAAVPPPVDLNLQTVLDRSPEGEPDSLNHDVHHEHHQVRTGLQRSALIKCSQDKQQNVDQYEANSLDEDCRTWNQYPSVLANPAGKSTSAIQIMHRMCVATLRRRIDAMDTPYNVPKSRSLTAEEKLGVASRSEPSRRLLICS